MSESGTALLATHEAEPRNMGRMAVADAIGNVGSITVGKALRFFLALEGEQITAAKFQVFACAEMVPSASALTELVTGMSLDEALALDDQALCERWQLDRFELPPFIWALEALHDAIARHRGTSMPASEPVVPEALLCRCHNVSEAAVKALIADGVATSVEAIGQANGAGTGCGSCKRDIERLLAETDRGAGLIAPASSSSGRGRVGLMKQIMGACAELMEAYAGELELWNLGDGLELEIKLSGVLAEDGPDRRGVLERLERTCKDDVDPLISVRVLD